MAELSYIQLQNLIFPDETGFFMHVSNHSTWLSVNITLHMEITTGKGRNSFLVI